MKVYSACGHYILVKRDSSEIEEVTKGGIVLPGNSDTKRRKEQGTPNATVINMGPNCFAGHQRPDGEWGGMWCEPGDRIQIAKHAGQEYEAPRDCTKEEAKEYALLQWITDSDVTGVDRGEEI